MTRIIKWSVAILAAMILSAGLHASADLYAQTAAEPSARPLAVRKNLTNTWQIKRSTFDGVEVRMTLGQVNDVRTVEVPQQGRFLTLGVDGYVSMGPVGMPALPCQVKIIEIPQGAEPVVEILHDKVSVIDLPAQDGRLPLYPMQAPVSKGSRPEPAFAYRQEAYAAQGYYAQELVRVEIMGESRGVRLAKVIVSPVEYEPVRHRLRVHADLAFDIRFEGADYQATQSKKRRYASQGFRIAQQMGVNAEAMRLDAPAAKAHRVEDETPLRYIIVADPKFRDSLQGFVRWKREQGYDVRDVYTDDARVGKTNTSIAAYLKRLYEDATEKDPAPTYILLVGDIKEIPPFDSREEDRYFQGHVTDLYFVEYTGDKLPDAYVGRFSATTVEELMPQIRKTMYMSRLAEESADFVNTTVLIAGNDTKHNFTHLNPALRYINIYASEEEGVTSHLYLAPTSSTGEMEDEIIERLSDGAGLVCYTGHGLEDEWCQPHISTAVVRQKFANKDKYPMMIGNCCLTGGFDYVTPCFGEELLRQADKGAVAYIGATNSSYFDEDFYWAVGLAEISADTSKRYYFDNTGTGAMDCFYHTHGEAYGDWAVTASDMIYKGNMSVEGSGSKLSSYYWEIYELFGDPSYRPYKHKPKTTPLDCAREIVVGASVLNVTTAPYAQLALSDSTGKLVAVVSADANGLAEVPTTAVQVGRYQLYGGAAGYADHAVTIQALMPEGQFVFVESVQVYDGDVEVETGRYGRRYALSMRLKNIGTADVSSLKIELTSDDPYFVAGEAYTYTEANAPGAVLQVDKKIFFSVSPDIPNGHLMRFQVKLTPDQVTEPMTRGFSFAALASELSLVSMAIDDAAAATPNGVLDNGETVSVTLRICNHGFAEARDVKTTFESEKDYLILPEGAADWGTIPAGDTVTHTFVLSAKEGPYRYDVYTVACRMNADGREQTVEAVSYIGPVIETFESGDFQFVDWDVASDWVISDSGAYAGRYCAASARIGDRDTSRLRLTVDVLLDDEVGFHYRTSTEGLTSTVGDFLIFLIDGQLQGRWNRVNPWTYVSYPVSAGEHTLEWLYVKDASTAAEEDRVWIDDLRLPIGSHAPLTPNECVFDLSAAGEPLFAVIGSATYELNLRFKAVKAGRGRLYLLNALGEHVRTLANDLRLAEGESIHTFSTAGLKPGLYVCVFEGADGRAAVKFIKR